MDLFEHREATTQEGAPLAERMRPTTVAEFVGQGHLFGKDKILTAAIAADRVPSMILWGPPGSGKTTLAHVIAHETKGRFVLFSAVLGGVPELRKMIEQAAEQKRMYGKRTILFIDEIHRFNKAQQDALLPHVEKGTVTLIGATTENPSFAVNGALLSRARVFQLHALSVEEVKEVLRHALSNRERGLGSLHAQIDDELLELIAAASDGDARRALSTLELAVQHACSHEGKLILTRDAVEQALASKTLLYDKSGEEHYNVVSAFIKSMRGSDPDAAVYWMMRMIEAGDDPLFVLRRMIIFASEDIGNADPNALTVAVSADSAFRRLGMPEGLFAIGQCCTYLATAPKSNASYLAWSRAQEDIKKTGTLPVPLKLRNAVTKSMKQWGYGEGYRYPHNEGGYAEGEAYLPEALEGRRYYEPTDRGYEADVQKTLKKIRVTPDQK